MRRKRRSIVAILVAAALGVVCSGCGDKTQSEADTSQNLPKIVVGSDNYPPFNYEDSNGEPTGIDVDLAKEAFYRMGYKAEFEYINWEEKKELVDQGEIDCIWGSFSIDGREDQYRWTDPYMVSRQVVAVNVNSDIYTLADLDGKKVAVQSTTKPEEIFENHTDPRIPELGEVFALQNRELIYAFLSKGYVEAIAAHETAILQSMKDYGLEYRILDETLLTVGLGVAFSKEDDRGLEQELSKVFEEMREDGTMEEILGRYLDHPETYLWEGADER